MITPKLMGSDCPDEDFRNLPAPKGKTIFRAVHNPRQPFVVKAGESTVKVPGTSFNIKIREKTSVRVSVLTGKVAFQNAVSTPGLILLKPKANTQE